MVVDKIVNLVLKMIVKRFKLDKLEKVYKYVFEDNELDEAIKDNTARIEKIERNMRGNFSPSIQKKWYDK